MKNSLSPNANNVPYFSFIVLNSLRKAKGEKVIADVKVDDAVLGMRGLPLMLYDGSALDPMAGITFRGHSIP